MDDNETQPEQNQADYNYNYHSAKLTFGLVLSEFKDAVKEGDGDRLFDVYKLALLLYKNHGHYKYAYAVLLYLVKCISILPPSQALKLKWNRTYNVSGLPGRNISLDLQKGQEQTLMSKMPREQQEPLNQDSLTTSELRDCMVRQHHFARRIPKEEEAVNQIIIELMTNDVFKNTPGREGYPSFPKFECNLLHGRDYRDLHNWLREHINHDLWGTIYQQEK